MILPGHIAAPLLAARRLNIDRRVAVLAGLAPDLIDKTVYYLLHASHWTRVPAHSPFLLILSTLLVALIGRLWRGNWRWGLAWLVGYGLHLLCDMLPPEGDLPWLWPLDRYASFVSSGRPWFLGGAPVPWLSLSAELVLVAVAVAVELAYWRTERVRGKPA